MFLKVHYKFIDYVLPLIFFVPYSSYSWNSVPACKIKSLWDYWDNSKWEGIALLPQCDFILLVKNLVGQKFFRELNLFLILLIGFVYAYQYNFFSFGSQCRFVILNILTILRTFPSVNDGSVLITNILEFAVYPPKCYAYVLPLYPQKFLWEKFYVFIFTDKEIEKKTHK